MLSESVTLWYGLSESWCRMWQSSWYMYFVFSLGHTLFHYLYDIAIDMVILLETISSVFMLSSNISEQLSPISFYMYVCVCHGKM